MATGEISGAAYPEPFPDEASCKVAQAKAEKVVKEQGTENGVIAYKLDCIKIDSSFKSPDIGKKS